MIQAATLNLTIEQGTTAGWQFTLKTSNGAPFDLNRCTIRAQAKANIEDPLPMASFACTIVDPYSGIFQMHLTRDESSKLASRRGVYDAFLDTSDGQTIKLLAGTLTIIPKVTK